MKKIVALVLAALLMNVSSVAFAVTQSDYDKVVEQRDALYQQLLDAGIAPCIDLTEAEPTPTEIPAGDFVVTHEYRWSTRYYDYWGIVVRNTSGQTCGFSAQVILYDADNNIIGVKNPEFDVCADGYEGFMYISNSDSFDHVDYSITTNNTYYKEVQSFVDVTAQKSGNKAILIAKNTGSVAAEFLEYTVLFLKGDEVVGTGWGYLVDKDDEIKPGKMEMREESCSADFDSVTVYFEGRYR